MKYFDFELLGIKRKLPFVKVAGRLALASFVVISDTELVKAAAPELVKRLPEVDLLLTAEAKGIILAYEMSRIMGMENFVVARKSYKPYMQNALSHTLRSVTTQKEQTLWLDGHEAERIRGKRVAIIDDVLQRVNHLLLLKRSPQPPVPRSLPALPFWLNWNLSADRI